VVNAVCDGIKERMAGGRLRPLLLQSRSFPGNNDSGVGRFYVLLLLPCRKFCASRRSERRRERREKPPEAVATRTPS
jgi:hypothetical protein